jgi:arylsulfatase A-like enzyme
MAVYLPGSVGGEIDVPVTNADVAPTLLELAGLPIPDGLTGASLVPLLRGEPGGPEPDRPIRLGWPGSDEVPAWVGLRRGDEVLIRWADGFEELYDLEDDPHQLRNLAAVPGAAPRRARLAALLPSFLEPGEPAR